MVYIVNQMSGTRECNCGNCGSALRYMPSETRRVEVNHDYLGDYDTVNQITCPACGQAVTVKG